MLTVLIKTVGPTHPDAECQIFQCKFVNFRRAETTLLGVDSIECDEWQFMLDAGKTAYVMNDAGKTVATYHGTSPPPPTSACADPALVARSYELRQSDLEAAIAAQIPPR